MNLLNKFALTEEEIGYKSGLTDANALSTILNLVYFWAGVIAVIIILIAGFFFVTSRGDANQMKRAKDAIRGAVIGLIVVMVAFAITRFVIGGVQG